MGTESRCKASQGVHLLTPKHWKRTGSRDLPVGGGWGARCSWLDTQEATKWLTVQKRNRNAGHGKEAAEERPEGQRVLEDMLIYRNGYIIKPCKTRVCIPMAKEFISVSLSDTHTPHTHTCGRHHHYHHHQQNPRQKQKQNKNTGKQQKIAFKPRLWHLTLVLFSVLLTRYVKSMASGLHHLEKILLPVGREPGRRWGRGKEYDQKYFMKKINKKIKEQKLE